MKVIVRQAIWIGFLLLAASAGRSKGNRLEEAVAILDQEHGHEYRISWIKAFECAARNVHREQVDAGSTWTMPDLEPGIGILLYLRLTASQGSECQDEVELFLLIDDRGKRVGSVDRAIARHARDHPGGRTAILKPTKAITYRLDGTDQVDLVFGKDVSYAVGGKLHEVHGRVNVRDPATAYEFYTFASSEVSGATCLSREDILVAVRGGLRYPPLWSRALKAALGWRDGASLQVVAQAVAEASGEQFIDALMEFQDAAERLDSTESKDLICRLASSRSGNETIQVLDVLRGRPFYDEVLVKCLEGEDEDRVVVCALEVMQGRFAEEATNKLLGSVRIAMTRARNPVTRLALRTVRYYLERRLR